MIAPNAFKNALPANEVAEALRRGIVHSGYTGALLCCPVGDGGDGTGKLLQRYLEAEYRVCTVPDPLQRPVQAGFAMTADGHTAVIEMAEASGLRLLTTSEYAPLIANTRGTGRLIKEAIGAGAKKIFLCIGGSATIDGGSGMMSELGIVYKNDCDAAITDFPLGLIALAAIDITNIDKRLNEVEIEILCDVRNTLLGEKGAAAVFGRQKGANNWDVKFLEQCMQNLDDVAYTTTKKRMSKMPHGGAAGGVAAALGVFCNGHAVEGITRFLELIQFDSVIQQADIVITGEGAVDYQTLDGKAPYGVAVAAKQHNLHVIAVAGKIEESEKDEMKKYFDELICINKPGVPLQDAIKNTRENLIKTGCQIGNNILKNYSNS